MEHNGNEHHLQLLPSTDEPVEDGAEPIVGAAFPVVGLGASAGGLEAFTQFLKALPADTGMAFVLVQHLSPTHTSALAEILSRVTKMPVMEVQDEPVVEPDHVYVIPPGRSMIISGGVLQLRPRQGPGELRAVDQFFRALAEDSKHRAIGVVLSGTATDGSLGLEAIKAEGGITFAQDSTAQHEGMPHSAIASGCVDFVLPPDAIAREIVRIGQHPYAEPEPRSGEPAAPGELAQIVELLYHASGVDFTHYKLNTLYRRITRRMVLRKVDGLAEYVSLLRQAPAEVDALYQDVLIGVTSFFRDPEAFEVLKSVVFPRLLEQRSRHEPVRIWTLGCSTGQEAYSLAMVYKELAEAAGGSAPPLQVFASDLNTAVIEKARAGVYSKDIVQDVSPERLRRFFTEVEGGYRIARSIRDTCVFSRHNVLADPPFSRIDLISCRNLLIYLGPELQQRVLPTLHFALQPAGYLWLGSSETIGAYHGLFKAEDAKHRVYSKREVTGAAQFPPRHGTMTRSQLPLGVRWPETAVDLFKEADRLLLTEFVPPGVLISAELEILQYRGDTGPYLAPTPGKASLSLLRMLREGLVFGVRSAVERARREEAPTTEEGLRVTSDDGTDREVAVEVIPLKGGAAKEGGFLILFLERKEGGEQPRDSSRRQRRAAKAPRPVDPSDAARLSQELTAMREYLQSVIEQQGTANEELQSANEEVQAANEELQSTNEELETSKEEIQSSNEELATLNDELQNRNEELDRLNNDLANLVGSVQMPIVMLGPDLCIRRFTPAAEKLLNLLPTDMGRPIASLRLNFENLDDLEPLLSEVLDSLVTREREIQDRQGRWYSLRLRPYRTLDNKIDGIVLLLVDVDAMKRAHEHSASVVATVREPLLVLGPDLRVRTANDAFYQTFRAAPEEIENRLFFELGRGQWNLPDLRRQMEEVLRGDSQVDDFQIEQEFEHIGRKTMLLNARRLRQMTEPLILLAIEDITERKRLEGDLQKFAADLSESDRRKDEFLAMLAHELRNPLAPIRNALEILRLTGGDEQRVVLASGMMERQVAQMVRLVDDLLDVSRISRGKIELRRERIELASVIQLGLEAVRPAIASMHQELQVLIEPQPIFLWADPARLAQVFGNLLNNASKFTGDGGRISLTVEREDAQAVIRVEDNGIGIDNDQLFRIFDLFMQVDASLGRSAGGLGIGLTLVKNLVELHGGTVEAHSAGAGLGSQFVVRLPALVEKKPEPPSEPAVSELTTPPARRILVVDDNRDSATSLAQLLELTGNKTHTAYDGFEAVEAAATWRPEVVLLDIGLPKLNGYEVAGKIREQPWGQSMVLIALTGWGQDEDRRKSKEAGFNAHLVKPVEYANLLKLLAELPRA